MKWKQTPQESAIGSRWPQWPPSKQKQKQVLQGCAEVEIACAVLVESRAVQPRGTMAGRFLRSSERRVASCAHNFSSRDYTWQAGITAMFRTAPFTVTSVWKQTSVCWWKSKVWSPRMMECHSVFNRREILMLLCGWTLRALRCMKREETLCDSTGMTGLQQRASQRQKTERSESVSSACRTSAHQMRKLWGSIPQLCEQTEHLSTGCFGMVLWWQSLCYVIFLPQ